MGDLRFVLAAIAVFAAAFAGMSYGMPLVKGIGATSASTLPPKYGERFVSEQDIEPAGVELAATAPATPEPAKPKHAIQEPPRQLAAATAPVAPAAMAAPPAARADSGERLAQTALQAAQAYARAPCDLMAKTAFIVAASTYLRAQDASPQAPRDMRVHDAIKTALHTGQIGGADFPPDLMIAGRFAPAPPSRVACVNSAGLRP